jgi:cytochrome o ubiquinol oxidase subunit IV
MATKTQHTHPVQHGSLRAYVIGLVSSLVITLVAFTFVYIHVQSGHQTFAHHFLIPLVGALAVVQMFVQLFFFLHLGTEGKPRWNVKVFLFMVVVVLIVTVGSIWIMDNLNYNMMPKSPKQINQYMNSQDSL